MFLRRLIRIKAIGENVKFETQQLIYGSNFINLLRGLLFLVELRRDCKYVFHLDNH
jgi:hypothetical protein